MFELTNTERKCLGLREVKDTWEKVEYENTKKLEYEKGKINKIVVYYEGNIIKKVIEYFISEVIESYSERDDAIETTKNKTYALGKRNKKEYKITRSYLSSENKLGTKMAFHFHNNYISLRKEPSCIEYYYSLDNEFKTFKELKCWLNTWVKETTEEDIKDIETFLNTPSKIQKYKDGDVFRFKIGRREYGYGRIILNVNKYRGKNRIKDKYPAFEWLMGTPILVEVYKIITNKNNLKVEDLKPLDTFPSQYILDNSIHKGEMKIIGNINLTDHENYPIQFYSSHDTNNYKYLYLQQGFKVKKIYPKSKEDISEILRKYINPLNINDFSFRGTSFYLNETRNLNKMRKQIEENYIIYDKDDLRSPENKEIRDYLFKYFNFEEQE